MRTRLPLARLDATWAWLPGGWPALATGMTAGVATGGVATGIATGIAAGAASNVGEHYVGDHYHAIGPELLIEKGDEYLHPCGRFIPFPLEAVGRPVTSGLLARRASSRR